MERAPGGDSCCRAAAPCLPVIREETAMKDFHCRDAGLDCDFVARGESEKEILEQAGKHAEQAHRMKASPELTERVRGLIHEESSDAHRRSATRR